MPAHTVIVNKEDVEAKLNTINPILLEEIKHYASDVAAIRPKLVFVAIDNDLLPKVEFIKKVVLKKGYIPIVGESALGTYLVTNHYGGTKEPILGDCLPLIDLCDEFWIVTDNPVTDEMGLTRGIPDGVLFEIKYWQLTSPEITVSLINLPSLSSDSLELNVSTIELLFDESFHQQVNHALERQMRERHPTRYIATSDSHSKYVDWLRKSAFVNKQVPVSPHTLISTSTLLMAHDDVLTDSQIIRYHAEIALKCNNIYLCGPTHSEDITLNDIDTHNLFVLFLMHCFVGEQSIAIKYQSFHDADIPKYKNPTVWAVTDAEAVKTQAEQGKLAGGDVRISSQDMPITAMYDQKSSVLLFKPSVNPLGHAKSSDPLVKKSSSDTELLAHMSAHR